MSIPRYRRMIAAARGEAHFRVHGIQFDGHPRIIGPRLKFDARGSIRVGRGFMAQGRQFSSQIGAGPNGQLVLGVGVFINQGCFVFAAQRVEIGDYTRLADLVFVTDTNFHAVSPRQPLKVAPVIVGRNVWIGAKATVLPGVTIGDHAVIGAGSVVTKDVPSRCVVAGSPAVVVASFDCPDSWIRD